MPYADAWLLEWRSFSSHPNAERGAVGNRTSVSSWLYLQRIRHLLALLAICSAAFCRAQKAVSPVTAFTTEQIVQKALPSIVSVEAGDKSGSGFVADGMVFTCYHVLDGAKEAIITFHDGTKARVASVLIADKERDIAALAVSVDRYPGFNLGDYAAVKVGSKAVVIGSPLGLSETVTEGIVSAKRGLESKDVLQLSAGISPGSSGSPVLNDHCEVIGMVTSTIEGGQTLNLAISGKDLKQTWGVSMDKAFASNKPTTIVGELDTPTAAKPGLASSGAACLEGVNSLDVLVEDVQDDLGVPRGLIELWTRSAVRSAGIRVMEPKDLVPAKALGTSRGLIALKEIDEFARYLYISVSSVKDQRETTFYHITARIKREAIVFPGIWMTVSVLDKARGGYFGAAVSADDVIRKAIDTIVKDITDKIKTANP